MKILVIAHPYDPLAYSVATAFHQSFLSIGHESTLAPQYEFGYDICLVMYAHVQYNFPRDNTYKIAYNWEDVHNPMWRKRVHRALGQFNCIFEMSKENLKVDLPIKRLHCPMGYHPSFEISYVAGSRQNVALIGYVPWKSYRHKMVETIEQKLGSKVWCVRTKDRWANANNQHLNQIIFNTSIQLNIHRNPKYRMFEAIRVIAQELSNKCFIVSEPSVDSPLMNGQHYVETDRFADTIGFYLEHPEECSKIAQCGYDFIKSSYRLKDHLANCLKQIGI